MEYTPLLPHQKRQHQRTSFWVECGRIERNWDRSHIDTRLYDPLVNIDIPNFNDYLTFDVGLAYLTTKFSVQASIKNLAFSPIQSGPYNSLETANEVRFRRYVLGLQYELYTLSGWNFEPSFYSSMPNKIDKTSLI